MRIDGKQIAKEILDGLEIKVQKLKEKNVIPHLVIILVGNDPASVAYVNQKKKKAETLGCIASIVHIPSVVSEEELLSTIEQYNNDKNIHGIIVQRPLPAHISSELLNEKTAPEKDVDAFHPQTQFKMPLAAAVFKILEYVHKETDNKDHFLDWLKSQIITVIGKGETGGGPVISLLRTLGIEPLIIDSKTTNPEQLTKTADIVISTVGKEHVVKPTELKPGVILIGVGMYKGEDEKLHADYNENEIQDIASFYTPVPGGVGPVNVAMLLSNLIESASS